MSNSIKTSRFDSFYIKEDHSSEPKEYFKESLKFIGPKLNIKNSSILDIGCAAGDFLRFVDRQYLDVNCHGLDAFPHLLAEAQKRVPNAQFHLRDMNSAELPNLNEQFDVVTMLGVLSIFSTENWIDNFASLIKPGGMGLIFGMINPFPYDVFVRLRNQSGQDEYGWNSWSADTLKSRFNAKGFSSEIEFWKPELSISYRPTEPLRSWTTDLKDGSVMITNGSRMIHDFAFMVVRHK
jgi:2-polyprenyl-3-methyl-5-hydroxy-6-metoxy-1,4-benzoquinol methylase